MKKIQFGMVLITGILFLLAGCTEYEDETYLIEEFDNGVMTLLDNPDYTATQVDSFFSDLLSVDSSMTETNYDSILINNSQVRDSLITKMKLENYSLAPSVNRKSVPVEGEVMMALIDLNSTVDKEYVFYLDSYMLLEFYDLNHNMKEVKTDNRFPLELLALTKNIKERFEVTLGNSEYLMVMKVTEASKNVNNVGLTFTTVDYEGDSPICSYFEGTDLSLFALSPGDLDTNWAGQTINTAFLADSGVIDIVSDGFEMASLNTKYFVKLSKDAKEGYFLVSKSNGITLYADKAVQFSLFSLDSAGVEMPVSNKGVTLEEAMGCKLVSRYQIDLTKGIRYLVHALPKEGITQFNMVVR